MDSSYKEFRGKGGVTRESSPTQGPSHFRSLPYPAASRTDRNRGSGGNAINVSRPCHSQKEKETALTCKALILMAPHGLLEPVRQVDGTRTITKGTVQSL